MFSLSQGWTLQKGVSESKEENNDKQQQTYGTAILTQEFDDVEALIVHDKDTQKEQILYSGCSFRMCPVKMCFETLEPVQGEAVLLGNNKA